MFVAHVASRPDFDQHQHMHRGVTKGRATYFARVTCAYVVIEIALNKLHSSRTRMSAASHSRHYCSELRGLEESAYTSNA